MIRMNSIHDAENYWHRNCILDHRVIFDTRNVMGYLTEQENFWAGTLAMTTSRETNRMASYTPKWRCGRR